MALKVMIEKLQEYNISKIYRIKDVVGKNKLEIFDGNKNVGNRIQKIIFDTDKPILPYFEIPITDKCNLNCKGCLFGCNAKSKQADIPFENIKADIIRMAELFYSVPWIRILGGEPLMHPKLIEILQCAKNVFPKSDIDLCTNGLLLPKMSDDFFHCLRDNDISLHISGYPPTFKMIDQIRAKLDEYGIEAVTLEREEFSKFYSLTPDNNPQTSYNKCFTSACREVYKGRISNCSGIIAFEKLNKQFGTKYDVCAGVDYIDIHQKDLTGKDIIERLNKPTPACRYCNMENMENFEWDVAGNKVSINDYIV